MRDFIICWGAGLGIGMYLDILWYYFNTGFGYHSCTISVLVLGIVLWLGVGWVLWPVSERAAATQLFQLLPLPSNICLCPTALPILHTADVRYCVLVLCRARLANKGGGG